MGKWRTITRLWSFIFRRWLDEGEEVRAVVGWRSARVHTRSGGIKCMTPCFWWFQ